jgi:hypothetical protein
VNWLFDKRLIKKEISFMKRKVITKEESISPKASLLAWYIDANLQPVGASELAALDWRNRADITIVIVAAAVTAVCQGLVIL